MELSKSCLRMNFLATVLATSSPLSLIFSTLDAPILTSSINLGQSLLMKLGATECVCLTLPIFSQVSLSTSLFCLPFHSRCTLLSKFFTTPGDLDLLYSIVQGLKEHFVSSFSSSTCLQSMFSFLSLLTYKLLVISLIYSTVPVLPFRTASSCLGSTKSFSSLRRCIISQCGTESWWMNCSLFSLRYFCRECAARLLLCSLICGLKEYSHTAVLFLLSTQSELTLTLQNVRINFLSLNTSSQGCALTNTSLFQAIYLNQANSFMMLSTSLGGSAQGSSRILSRASTLALTTSSLSSQSQRSSHSCACTASHSQSFALRKHWVTFWNGWKRSLFWGSSWREIADFNCSQSLAVRRAYDAAVILGLLAAATIDWSYSSWRVVWMALRRWKLRLQSRTWGLYSYLLPIDIQFISLHYTVDKGE